MRNYVLLFFGNVTYTSAGGPPPTVTATVVGEDEDDCNAGLDNEADTLQGLGFTILGKAIVAKRYFLLDKTTVVQTIQPNAAFWLTATGFQQGTGCTVEGTPRSQGTWPSSDGLRVSGGAKTTAGKGGTGTISLLSYLLLLLNTWQNVKPTAPKRWIDWLTLLISHYSRYTPTQIYAFLARVDFSAKTFKV